MCAIKPAHKKRFIIDVYTSKRQPKAEFDKGVLEVMLKTELTLNSITDYRWHLREAREDAE